MIDQLVQLIVSGPPWDGALGNLAIAAALAWIALSVQRLSRRLQALERSGPGPVEGRANALPEPCPNPVEGRGPAQSERRSRSAGACPPPGLLRFRRRLRALEERRAGSVEVRAGVLPEWDPEPLEGRQPASNPQTRSAGACPPGRWTESSGRQSVLFDGLPGPELLPAAPSRGAITGVAPATALWESGHMTPEQRHRARFYIDHEQQMARRRAELLAQQPWWSPRGSRVFLWFAGLAVLVLAGCLSAGWALQ